MRVDCVDHRQRTGPLVREVQHHRASEGSRAGFCCAARHVGGNLHEVRVCAKPRMWVYPCNAVTLGGVLPRRLGRYGVPMPMVIGPDVATLNRNNYFSEFLDAASALKLKLDAITIHQVVVVCDPVHRLPWVTRGVARSVLLRWSYGH